MIITFHGAAGGVTGSKHLIEYHGKKILLDCGMFQGRRKETRALNSTFPFDPKEIDTVILSHAHLDHCGLLPLLVKQGFSGSIHATPATQDVAHHILRDSAHIQEWDFRYLKKKRVRGYDTLAQPLYTRYDIPPVMRRFSDIEYVRRGGGWVRILPGVRVKFYDAGHILGSAVVVLELKHGSERVRVAYTGDLGRRSAPLLHNPHYIHDHVDVMLSESTYGAREHRSPQEAHEKIVDIVNTICRNKSKLIIPAFSLGRTQEIVYVLHHLTDTGRIPRIPVYVDSPLAVRLTDIFKAHRDEYDLESSLDFPRGGDVPLAFRNLKYVKSRDESIALNRAQGPIAIISASGMAEGGRILHHLKHSLRSSKNCILFTGYQAEHTLGRRLLEGRSPVRIYGRQYAVRARIEVVNELSAHADGHELAEYITRTKGVSDAFLVHGEGTRAKQLQRLLKQKAPGLRVRIPKRGQSFEL